MDNIHNVNKKEISEKITVATEEAPRSLAVAKKGIHTSQDFSQLMSSLMSDIIEGRVTPAIGNATVNAGGKLLKMVEMQLKYGTQKPGDSVKMIELVPMTV